MEESYLTLQPFRLSWYDDHLFNCKVGVRRVRTRLLNGPGVIEKDLVKG